MCVLPLLLLAKWNGTDISARLQYYVRSRSRTHSSFRVTKLTLVLLLLTARCMWSSSRLRHHLVCLISLHPPHTRADIYLLTAAVPSKLSNLGSPTLEH